MGEPLDLAGLAELARGVQGHPRPWRYSQARYDGIWHVVVDAVGHGVCNMGVCEPSASGLASAQDESVARYLAAVPPEVVLELLSRAEALTVERDGAVERARLCLEAKDYWVTRALEGEGRLCLVREAISEADRRVAAASSTRTLLDALESGLALVRAALTEEAPRG